LIKVPQTYQLSSAFERAVRECILEPKITRDKERANWRDIESTYSRQRIWKKVAKLVAHGVCDHLEEGLAASLEPAPASWSIPVTGRPKASLNEGDTLY
jgi:hypothetical protein